MSSLLVSKQSATFAKPRPEVRPGYTVRVHEKIVEGDKERVQIFEGLVISAHKGATDADHTITVRRIASGVGVEKVFPLHSPKIEQIEVKKVAKVRRAKLFFLRGRRGKAARLSERFTNAGEFDVAIVPEDTEADEGTEVVEEAEAPAEEKTEEEGQKTDVSVEERPSAGANQGEEEGKEVIEGTEGTEEEKEEGQKAEDEGQKAEGEESTSEEEKKS